MATRATIKIEWINFAKIYKHWDGYPEEMLKPLEKFNKAFKRNRGEDPEYKFAQLLRWSQELFEDDNRYTWWWVIEKNADYGESYEYTLKLNWKVTIK